MAIYDIDGNLVETELSFSEIPPVPLSTFNAMLKCAYTYIDACRAGNLVYGDGTGVNQQAGKISCSTFMRQLLQGIPYNDYLTGSATTTSASGKKWRYGYRMIGEDYYATDATTTAQRIYDQFKEDGRAFEIDYNFENVMSGDLICFGEDTSSIRHIGMFICKDVNGDAYIMDSNSSSRNGNLAIRIHKAYDHEASPSNNPVGVVRPNLSEASVPLDEVAVTASNGTITGEVLNGYGHFLKLSASVTANTEVTYGDSSFTPNNTGKDFRIIPVVSTSDTTTVLTYSGVANVECEMSHYL